jgi:hypothetical protein
MRFPSSRGQCLHMWKRSVLIEADESLHQLNACWILQVDYRMDFVNTRTNLVQTKTSISNCIAVVVGQFEVGTKSNSYNSQLFRSCIRSYEGPEKEQQQQQHFLR